MKKALNFFLPPDPHCQRHTDKSFPPYRFIPGETPHPTRDPQGHSYGEGTEKLVYIEPAQWRENLAYLYGVDLYNFAFWWEAHEQWENVWHTTNKESAHGQFLQGLIQISAAFIKWHLHQQEGLEKLYSLGMKRLQFVLAGHKVFMGLSLPGHVDKIQRHFLPALGPHKSWPNPCKGYPLIALTSHPY